MFYGFSGLRQPTDRDILTLQALKVPWIRDGVERPEWSRLYPLSQAGINIVGNLGKAMMRQDFGLQDWEDKVAEVVQKYPGVKAWEIWNEPQNPAERQGYWNGDPSRYADMLRVAFSTIKKANPNAIVLGFGGLPANVMNTPAQELRETVLRRGGAEFFDVLSVHVYPSVKPPQPGVTLDQRITRMRNGLRDHVATVGKPIWLTETAAGSNWWNQQEYIQKAFPTFGECGVEAIFWFTLRDGPNAIDSAGYGLLDVNGTPKPGYAAFAAVAEGRA